MNSETRLAALEKKMGKRKKKKKKRIERRRVKEEQHEILFESDYNVFFFGKTKKNM